MPDAFVLQMLKDVQRIKGLETDVVLLQFWLAGLTGLAESGSSNQRLIWKSLVLVKVRGGREQHDRLTKVLLRVD